MPMELKATHMQLAPILFLISLTTVGTATSEALPGCQEICGNVSIPYPFGIGKSSLSGRNCFFEEAMELKCINSTLSRLKANVSILNIDLLKGQMDISFPVSYVCKNEAYGSRNRFGLGQILSSPAFSISSNDNKFVSVGCDTYGYLNNFHNGEKSSTGCLTRCKSKDDVPNDGDCTGIGCCQVDIPRAMKNISIQAFSYNNFNDSWRINNCSYSFVVKKDNYTFVADHLKGLPFDKAPIVVDWIIGREPCKISQHGPNYACQSNSRCEDSTAGYGGYRCMCEEGYEGNPYLPNGCQDIDECKIGNHTCMSEKHCHNTNGSYECFCPNGQSGNGTKEKPCVRKNVVTDVIIGVGAGIIILFVGTTSVYMIYQKRKLIRLREKNFQQNGGFILLQQLSREHSFQITQIFTEEQLKKATNNFDESLIIGRGGYGTVFKGYLADNRIVAVKKSRIVDASQNEQFVNEVIVLSQINHRNVVKLLGCCLETEVPLLVYEFVNNGTLFDYLHNEREVNNATWKVRRRIAAEAAVALSYLHSEASVPIIHRDVKTANILLDDTYTAKVSDFGASRLVPLDQTELATMVQGTIGYLDPEYMQTCQLTEKSDVYSFGVVLVELLTGEKPHSFGGPEEKRSLANHFLSYLKEDRLLDVLQVGILNEENKQEIVEVAILAAKCLRLNGEERPGMKEIAIELEGIRHLEKHPWANTDQNLEETRYLLNEASSSFNQPGDSGSYQYTGYDSIKDRVLIALDDGR